MRINQNIAAFNAYRNLSQTQNRLGSSLEKLSSGFRINRAADDAAGLVNSENLRSQIGGLKVATRNAQDAISLVQTAEGAQTEVHAILQRMRDLAVQSGNLGTNDTAALTANQEEFNELVAELDRIDSQTQFGTLAIFSAFDPVSDTSASAGSYAFDWTAGGTTTVGTWSVTVDGASTPLTVDVAQNATAGTVATALSGLAGVTASADGNRITVTSDSTGASSSVAVSWGGATGSTANAAATAGQDAGTTGGAVFQVGANSNQVVRVGITGVSAAALQVSGLNIGQGANEGDIANAIEAIDSAISTVSSNRAELGAFQNRMESTIRNVQVAVENLSAAESRIRDTDMALEMVEFTRNQILQQAGTAMLAQANLVPQSVLSLL